MKSTEVDESLSATTTTVLFQRKPTCFKNPKDDTDEDPYLWLDQNDPRRCMLDEEIP